MVKFVDFTVGPPNNSLEQTPPWVECMVGVDERRRSARSRWVASE